MDKMEVNEGGIKTDNSSTNQGSPSSKELNNQDALPEGATGGGIKTDGSSTIQGSPSSKEPNHQDALPKGATGGGKEPNTEASDGEIATESGGSHGTKLETSAGETEYERTNEPENFGIQSFHADDSFTEQEDRKKTQHGHSFEELSSGVSGQENDNDRGIIHKKEHNQNTEGDEVQSDQVPEGSGDYDRVRQDIEVSGADTARSDSQSTESQEQLKDNNAARKDAMLSNHGNKQSNKSQYKGSGKSKVNSQSQKELDTRTNENMPSFVSNKMDSNSLQGNFSRSTGDSDSYVKVPSQGSLHTDRLASSCSSLPQIQAFDDNKLISTPDSNNPTDDDVLKPSGKIKEPKNKRTDDRQLAENVTEQIEGGTLHVSELEERDADGQQSSISHAFPSLDFFSESFEVIKHTSSMTDSEDIQGSIDKKNDEHEDGRDSMAKPNPSYEKNEQDQRKIQVPYNVRVRELSDNIQKHVTEENASNFQKFKIQHTVESEGQAFREDLDYCNIPPNDSQSFVLVTEDSIPGQDSEAGKNSNKSNGNDLQNDPKSADHSRQNTCQSNDFHLTDDPILKDGLQDKKQGTTNTTNNFQEPKTQNQEQFKEAKHEDNGESLDSQCDGQSGPDYSLRDIEGVLKDESFEVLSQSLVVNVKENLQSNLTRKSYQKRGEDEESFTAGSNNQTLEGEHPAEEVDTAKSGDDDSFEKISENGDSGEDQTESNLSINAEIKISILETDRTGDDHQLLSGTLAEHKTGTTKSPESHLSQVVIDGSCVPLPDDDEAEEEGEGTFNVDENHETPKTDTLRDDENLMASRKGNKDIPEIHNSDEMEDKSGVKSKLIVDENISTKPQSRDISKDLDEEPGARQLLDETNTHPDVSDIADEISQDVADPVDSKGGPRTSVDDEDQEDLSSSTRSINDLCVYEDGEKAGSILTSQNQTSDNDCKNQSHENDDSILDEIHTDLKPEEASLTQKSTESSGWSLLSKTEVDDCNSSRNSHQNNDEIVDESENIGNANNGKYYVDEDKMTDGRGKVTGDRDNTGNNKETERALSDNDDGESASYENDNKGKVLDDNEDRGMILRNKEKERDLSDNDDRGKPLDNNDDRGKPLDNNDDRGKALDDNGDRGKALDDNKDDRGKALDDNNDRGKALDDNDHRRKALYDNGDRGKALDYNNDRGKALDDNDVRGKALDDNDDRREALYDNDDRGKTLDDNDDRGKALEDNDDRGKALDDNDDRRKALNNRGRERAFCDRDDRKKEGTENRIDYEDDVNEMTETECLDKGAKMSAHGTEASIVEKDFSHVIPVTEVENESYTEDPNVKDRQSVQSEKEDASTSLPRSLVYDSQTKRWIMGSGYTKNQRKKNDRPKIAKTRSADHTSHRDTEEVSASKPAASELSSSSFEYVDEKTQSQHLEITMNRMWTGIEIEGICADVHSVKLEDEIEFHIWLFVLNKSLQLKTELDRYQTAIQQKNTHTSTFLVKYTGHPFERIEEIQDWWKKIMTAIRNILTGISASTFPRPVSLSQRAFLSVMNDLDFVKKGLITLPDIQTKDQDVLLIGQKCNMMKILCDICEKFDVLQFTVDSVIIKALIVVTDEDNTQIMREFHLDEMLKDERNVELVIKTQTVICLGNSAFMQELKDLLQAKKWMFRFLGHCELKEPPMLCMMKNRENRQYVEDHLSRCRLGHHVIDYNQQGNIVLFAKNQQTASTLMGSLKACFKHGVLKLKKQAGVKKHLRELPEKCGNRAVVDFYQENKCIVVNLHARIDEFQTCYKKIQNIAAEPENMMSCRYNKNLYDICARLHKESFNNEELTVTEDGSFVLIRGEKSLMLKIEGQVSQLRDNLIVQLHQLPKGVLPVGNKQRCKIENTHHCFVEVKTDILTESNDLESSLGDTGACASLTESWDFNGVQIKSSHSDIYKTDVDVVVIPTDHGAQIGHIRAKDIPVNMVEIKLVIPRYSGGGKDPSNLGTAFANLFQYLNGMKKSVSIAIPLFEICNWNHIKFMKRLLHSLKESTQKTDKTQVKEIVVCVPGPKEEADVKKVVENATSTPKSAAQASEEAACPIRSEESSSKFAVIVKLGDITKEKVGAIVNTTSKDLEMSVGKVSEAILIAAGMKIQEQCKLRNRYGKQLPPGKIITTDGFQLQCQKVYHGALEEWTTDKYKRRIVMDHLKEFINNCLQEAEKDGMSSLSFPTLGTGNMNYPVDVVAVTMLTEIRNYGNSHPESSLRKVTIVVYEKTPVIYQAFTKEYEKQFGTVPTSSVDPCPPGRIFKFPSYVLEVASGDIKTVIDYQGLVLLWSQDDIMNDNASGLSILRVAGSKVYEQWISSKHKLQENEIMPLDAGKLEFISLLNVFANTGKSLVDAFKHGLTESAGYGAESVVFWLGKKDKLATKLGQYALCLVQALNSVSETFCEQKRRIKICVEDPQQCNKLQTELVSAKEKPHTHKKEKRTYRKIVYKITGTTQQNVDAAISALENSAPTENIQDDQNLEFCDIADKRVQVDPKLKVTDVKDLAKEADSPQITCEQSLKVTAVEPSGGLDDEQAEENDDYLRKNDEDEVDTMVPDEKRDDDTERHTLPLERSESVDCCLVAKSSKLTKDQLIQRIRKMFKKMEPVAIICPYNELDNQALVTYDTPKDATQARRSVFNNTTSDVAVEQMPPQVLIDIRATLDLSILDFSANRTIRPDVVESSLRNHSGVQIKKENKLNWILRGTLPQLEVAHAYLQGLVVGLPESVYFRKEEKKVKVNVEKEEKKVEVNLEKVEKDVQNITEALYEAYLFFHANSTPLSMEELRYDKENKSVHISGPKDSTEEMTRRLERLKTCECAVINISHKSFKVVDIKNRLHDLQQTHPDVYMYLPESEDVVEEISFIGLDKKSVQDVRTQAWGKLDLTTNRRNRFGDSQRGNSTRQEKNNTDTDTISGYNEGASARFVDKELPKTPKQSHYKAGDTFDVYVYEGDILRLDVDGIVNAANSQLEHGGGVAEAISRAAGRRFNHECRDYITQNGDIQVGTACFTSAGNLQYKRVIHTVGPRWSDYRGKNGKQKCEDLLRSAIIDAILKAEKCHLSKVAIPAISSGIYGVPRDICAAQYALGIISACSSLEKSRSHSLKEIHFVDKNSEMLSIVNNTFSQYLGASNDSPDYVDRPTDMNKSGQNMLNSEQIEERKRKDIESQQHGGRGYTIYPYSGGETQLGVPKYLYHFNSHLTIQVYIGNIIDSNADALVFGEDKELKSNSRIVQAIRKADVWSFDNQIKEIKRNNKIKIGKVFGMQLPYVRQNVVLCLVTPSWGLPGATDEDCANGLKRGVKTILDKAVEKRLKSIAMPLLGTGNQGAPIKKAAEIIINKIHEVFAGLEEGCILREIHLVNKDQHVVDILTAILEQCIPVRSKEQNCAMFSPKAGNAMTEDADTEYKDMYSERSSFNTTLNASKPTEGFREQQESENCVICMDDIDVEERKVLHKCKHVFHKDCIDMQFKHKPACPTCNMVYGIIEGNQPRNGKMNVNHYPYRYGNGLPGFETYGYFEIIYHFPDGVQKDDDPNPGKKYKGAYRRTYLPDNTRGRLILDMLKLAFQRRLTFTIGHSRTTGEENIITWNDIHHKTNRTGGPQRYGYPDPDYFDRVMDELKVKGITPDDVSGMRV